MRGGLQEREQELDKLVNRLRKGNTRYVTLGGFHQWKLLENFIRNIATSDGKNGFNENDLTDKFWLDDKGSSSNKRTLLEHIIYLWEDDRYTFEILKVVRDMCENPNIFYTQMELQKLWPELARYYEASGRKPDVAEMLFELLNDDPEQQRRLDLLRGENNSCSLALVSISHRGPYDWPLIKGDDLKILNDELLTKKNIEKIYSLEISSGISPDILLGRLVFSEINIKYKALLAKFAFEAYQSNRIVFSGVVSRDHPVSTAYEYLKLFRDYLDLTPATEWFVSYCRKLHNLKLTCPDLDSNLGYLSNLLRDVLVYIKGCVVNCDNVEQFKELIKELKAGNSIPESLTLYTRGVYRQSHEGETKRNNDENPEDASHANEDLSLAYNVRCIFDTFIVTADWFDKFKGVIQKEDRAKQEREKRLEQYKTQQAALIRGAIIQEVNELTNETTQYFTGLFHPARFSVPYQGKKNRDNANRRAEHCIRMCDSFSGNLDHKITPPNDLYSSISRRYYNIVVRFKDLHSKYPEAFQYPECKEEINKLAALVSSVSDDKRPRIVCIK